MIDVVMSSFQSFPVRARDLGTPQLRAEREAQVHIRILRNDRTPQFRNEPYSRTIQRTAAKGTDVVTVLAEDEDTTVTSTQL